jgi:glycosyltransferase involved in cell wall biosynthesis
MITAVVIAKNEEKNLPDCLAGLKFCSRVIVVDNNSVDTTAVVAKKHGAEVIRAPFSGDFAKLRNLALAKISTPWTLFVDADERVSAALAAEITVAVTNSKVTGYFLSRQDHLWGRVLKHGDTGNIQLLRLARTGLGFWHGQVHEHWQVTGQTESLINPLLHYPHPDLVSFLEKINLYSGIRAEELHHLGATSGLAAIIFYPLGKFFYLWICKLGFLDGTVGLIHAICMSFYTFLVRSKLFLLSVGIRDLSSKS